MSLYLTFLLIFFSSFLISILFFKALIKISIEKKIFDNPNVERKLHKTPIPNIGGVAFFFTIIFSMLIFGNFLSIPKIVNLLLAAGIILFLFGFKDDLVVLSSSKRFYGQILSGLIIIILGNFRIQNLSIIGFSTISYPLSVIISLLFFVFITNAYNLIDGVNGLLGSLAIFSSACFSIFFYLNSDFYLFALMLSVIATLLGFLYFNFGDASIFMGSCGSYLIGSVMYFNSISFLNPSFSPTFKASKFSFLFCILALPVYDTLRVFILRLLQNKSPFSADANHLHHRLLMLNLSHSSVVYILLIVNIILVSGNIFFYNQQDLFKLGFSILFLIFSNYILELFIKNKLVSKKVN
jgi:UDP-N-acetylmuramyl pentapeptide phosphotransferase/UDP-N-acetylglucosamine-1-phosphate transferase